jgi:hypothetical protein
MRAKDQDIFFTVLGKDLHYTRQTRPSFWHNDIPYPGKILLPLDAKTFPLQKFPLIEDFEVILERMEIVPENAKGASRIPFGYHVYFFSPSRGYIAGFPWWDHAEKDLQRDTFTIPLGDFQHPYTNLEQGWKIMIIKHDAFIYVLEADFDRMEIEGYRTWFKVAEQTYLNQWQSAIQACRQLDEVG